MSKNFSRYFSCSRSHKIYIRSNKIKLGSTYAYHALWPLSYDLYKIQDRDKSANRCNGGITSCRTRPSWYSGSSLGPHVLNGYGSMTSVPINTIYGTGDPALVDMWRTSHQNMKYQSSLRRRVITGGSQKDVRVSRRMDCRIGVIKFHVRANN